MQIQQYLKILKDDWWIVVAIFLISVGMGIAYSYSQDPVYETTATFVVNPTVSIAETYDKLYSIDTLAGRTSLATTYANILESQGRVDAAIALLGLPPEMASGYDIQAVALPDSTVLRLRVEGPSPLLAADLANAIGTVSLDYIGGEVYELRSLDPAMVESDPISPDHPTDIVLSAIVGLAAGVGFIVLRQLLSQLLNDTQDDSTLPPSSSHTNADVVDGINSKGVPTDAYAFDLTKQER